MNWFKHLFTEANNEVWDLKRVLAASGFLVWTGLAFTAVLVNHQDFSFLEAGSAIAAIVGATGAAIWAGKGGETPK